MIGIVMMTRMILYDMMMQLSPVQFSSVYNIHNQPRRNHTDMTRNHTKQHKSQFNQYGGLLMLGRNVLLFYTIAVQQIIEIERDASWRRFENIVLEFVF